MSTKQRDAAHRAAMVYTAQAGFAVPSAIAEGIISAALASLEAQAVQGEAVPSIQELAAGAHYPQVSAYTHPQPSPSDARDAERYRWLRDTLQGAVGGGVEVNDQKLVYEEPEPGEQVRVFWYPVTPVGFYESKGETLDAAIDAAMQAGKETT